MLMKQIFDETNDPQHNRNANQNPNFNFTFEP